MSLSPRGREALIAVGDFATILVAYALAYWIRFEGEIPPRNLAAFPYVAPLAAAIGVLFLVVYETHRNLHRPPADTYVSLALAVLVATGLGTTLPYLFGAAAFPRSVFLIAAPLELLLLALARRPFIAAARASLRRMRVTVVERDRVRAARLAREVAQSFGTREVEAVDEREFLRRIAPGPDGEAAPGGPRARPDAVFMGAGCRAEARRRAHAWAVCEGVPFYAVPSLYEVLMSRQVVTQVGDAPVVAARQPAVPPEYAWLKRLIDVVGALVLGLLGLPFLALAAALVRLTSRGPAFFAQARVGLHGRPFTMYKIRSMRDDAERETGAVLSGPGDPRVTPVGQVLRALRIDELPQLWNVLKGEMSLVGPRPERPEFVARFTAEEPLYALRHNVRPGLTGLAQVSAAYAADWREKLRHDLLYVTSASLLLDLKIIVLTLRAVLVPRSSPEPASWPGALARVAGGEPAPVTRARAPASGAAAEEADGRSPEGPGRRQW